MPTRPRGEIAPPLWAFLLSAKLYAYARQIERRNLTGQELHAAVARYVQLQDRVKPQGQRSDLASIDAKLPGGKSARETAAVLGVSQATIERTRAVLASDDEDTKAQLLSGAIAPSAASPAEQRIRRGTCVGTGCR